MSPASGRFCRRRYSLGSRSLRTTACCESFCSRATGHCGPLLPFRLATSQRSQSFCKRVQPYPDSVPRCRQKQSKPLPFRQSGRGNRPRGICFTNEASFRQPRVVRTSFAVLALVTAALGCVRAQDQEKKLVDRLLKPDMTLQNDAQNKKFTGDSSASVNKRANVGTFYVHQKSHSKTFGGTRDFSTTQFYSKTYRGGRSAYEVSSQQTVVNSKDTFASQTAHGVRDSSESGKKVASRGYAGTRPFLDEGKSQKSLNRHNEPLTIEQVRELLNKNK